MAAERHRRRPRRPKAYGVLFACAALVLAGSVAGTWWRAKRLDRAPEPIGLLQQGGWR